LRLTQPPPQLLAGETPTSTVVELMHHSLLRSADFGYGGPIAAYDEGGNRRSERLSTMNQVAQEGLLVTLENCRIDLPAWFAEFIRWHEPDGL